MEQDNNCPKTITWFNKQANKPSSKWWLALISLTESSIFPIPPDPFLVAILLVKREKWLYYSLIVAIFSTIGALLGYFIGFAFYEFIGKPLVNLYSLQDELLEVSHLFDKNTFWTMFVAAFTPIPFKVFTIAGGLFQVNIFVFLVASLIGRTLRFLIVGLIMKFFGKELLDNFVKYFNYVTITVLVLIFFYFIFKFL